MPFYIITSLLEFVKKKHYTFEITILFGVCPLSNMNQLSGFHETWDEHYATGAHLCTLQLPSNVKLVDVCTCEVEATLKSLHIGS
jgi:hypothetical protein